MAPNKKYLSLEEAAVELGLKPDELVRLREKGQIRGFADRGTWKFKADDIEEYNRSQQPDSDPDIPMLADYDDEESGREENAVGHGLDAKSDSDVRLVPSDDSKKKRLSGSSAEVVAFDSQKSDSDIRLVEHSPKDKRAKGGLKESDSNVKIVKPNVESDTDSDSDVKMINKPGLKPDSDSDVKLKEPLKPLPDSDSDVRMALSDSDVRKAGSDSDVRMSVSDSDVRPARLPDSDSDVKLRSYSAPDSESDSDVKLLPRRERKESSAHLPLAPVDFSVESADDESGFLLDPNDSGIKLGGDSGTRTILGSDVKRDGGTKRDSGIKVARDSGISLANDSGIKLSGDSGIRLQDDSGVQLIQPADSGISLEGMDSGVRFPDSGLTLGSDSGIALGADSGIRLGGSSGKNVKGKGGGKKRKGDSGRILEGPLDSGIGGIDVTSPMLMPDSDEVSGEFNISDTSELQALSESDQNVVLFDEDEHETMTAPAKARSKKSVKESDFEELEEPLDELEVADEDLSDASEFGDLDFDSRDEGLDESFSEGASQHEFDSPKKFEVAREVEWGAGACGLLFASICVLIVGSIVSADLLRIVWAGTADSTVDPGIAWLLAGLWK